MGTLENDLFGYKEVKGPPVTFTNSILQNNLMFQKQMIVCLDSSGL